jgi:signal peptidase I
MDTSIVLKAGRIKTFGTSMAPLFLPGDMVFFKKISPSSIRMHDVVVVRKKSMFITHRVVYIGKENSMS